MTELALEYVCVDWIECPPGRGRSIAPTGEAYAEICTGGEKRENDPILGMCESPEAAVADWLACVRDHARRHGANVGATLYWRVMPELHEVTVRFPHEEKRLRKLAKELGGPQPWWREGWDGNQKRYMIYSRLLITGKPVLSEAA
jgi:hypothetical protein